MLRFLGRGSAFHTENNCAFFVAGRRLVLLDCAMSAFNKIRHIGPDNLVGDRADGVTVLVTHTHSDHIGGIGMLVHYCYYVLGIPVEIVAPSGEVAQDLSFMLERLEGCCSKGYSITFGDHIIDGRICIPVATTHSGELNGRCFGWVIEKDGRRVVFTGDTNTLTPFLSRLSAGDHLYTEASAYNSSVHLCIRDCIPVLKKLREDGVKVFLMHLDNEKAITEAAADTGAELAPLYDEKQLYEPESEETEMTDNSKTLDEIFDIAQMLYQKMCEGSEDGHRAVFTYLTEFGKSLVIADRASFWKWDKKKHQLWTTSATKVDKIVIPDDTGLVGKALKEKRVVITNDPYSDPDFNSAVDRKTGYLTCSVLVMPVADMNGEYIGAFQLINKLGEGGFDEKEDVRKLSLAALICGMALESETFLEDSHFDKLTQLKNRMGFYHDFSHRYSRFLASGNTKPMSMFICDIDKFKSVNDTYGHNAGDDVLSMVANIISDTCRDGDCAYRWGGEEFIMLMPDTELKEAILMAETIRMDIMGTTIRSDGVPIKVTMSFGCRQFDFSESIEENIRLADEKLYIAKETGRNRVIS